jgi:hypothetical protein
LCVLINYIYAKRFIWVSVLTKMRKFSTSKTNFALKRKDSNFMTKFVLIKREDFGFYD